MGDMTSSVPHALKAARRLTRLAGAYCHLKEGKHKHPHLIVELNGQSRTIVFSGSPKSGVDIARFNVEREVKMALADMAVASG